MSVIQFLVLLLVLPWQPPCCNPVLNCPGSPALDPNPHLVGAAAAGAGPGVGGVLGGGGTRAGGAGAVGLCNAAGGRGCFRSAAHLFGKQGLGAGVKQAV